MRPIRLILSAFGPYADRQEIEMDKLGTKGLYLVTGDTGAGKTTIFDAIVFALFGTASGSVRETKTFRSKYADSDADTYVELLFEYKGERYLVRRNPEYERLKKKGNKSGNEMVRQAADAELELVGKGNIATQSRNVTAEIERLLGIDKEQFLQIAMIPQGEFRDLLVRKSEDRGKVLRNLFHTGRFEVFQGKLRDKSLELYKEVEKTKDSIRQYIDGIVYDEAEDYRTEYELLKEKYKDKKAILDGNADILLVMNIMEIQQKKYNDKIEEENHLEKQIQEKSVYLNTMESDFRNMQKLKQAEREHSDIVIQLEECKQKREKQTEWEHEKESLLIEINRGKSEVVQYDLLEQIEKSRIEISIRLNSMRTELENGQKKEQIALEMVREAEETIRQTEHLQQQRFEYTTKQKEIGNRIEEYLDIQNRISDYNQIQEKYQTILSAYEKKQQEYSRVKAQYDSMEQLFMDEQAGLLAKKLNPGTACPVCGSTEHPKLAKPNEEAPTQAELGSQKNKRDKLNEEYGTLSSQASEARKSVEIYEEEICKKYQKMESSDTKISLAEIESKVKQSLQLEQEEDFKTKKILKEIEIKLARGIKAEQERQQQNDIISEIRLKREQTSASIIKNETEERHQKEKESAIRQELKFQSKKELEAAISLKEKRVQEIRKQESELQEQYEQIKEKDSKIRTTIESMQEILQGKDIDGLNIVGIEVNRITNEITLLKEKKTDISRTGRVIFSHLSNNKTNIESVKEKVLELEKLEKRYTMIKKMSDTCMGTLTGKQKIKLETYIQMAYFEMILGKANIRLLKMTSGQYEFERCMQGDKLSSQTGLDINVIDHYNGSVRSVKTLSGGEAFKASLSLALGMADVVYSSSGGIRLDTMFVDEGFGSLDDESINQAIRTLNELTEGNRLVGIISHVDELKIKIDNHIDVVKNKNMGSSAIVKVL